MRAIIPVLFIVILAGCSKSNNNNAASASPDAQFSYTSARSFPFAVQFINQSVSPGPGTTYLWDFYDGEHNPNAPDSFVHYYVTLGTYLPKLIQIDAAGNRDTATATLNLTDTIGPSGSSSRTSSTVAFAYHITPFYTTVFTNTSANATSYLWDFGDGTTSTSAGATVSKDFEAPGTYHVKLKAMNGMAVDSSEAVINFN